MLNDIKIHHIAITVDNLEESISFYTNLLGFKLVKKFSRNDMDANAVFLELNNFQIEIWHFKNTKENKDLLTDIQIKGIRHIAFQVNNLTATIADLESKGLTFSTPKLGASGHMYSFTTDPNGIALEFYEK